MIELVGEEKRNFLEYLQDVNPGLHDALTFDQRDKNKPLAFKASSAVGLVWQQYDEAMG